MMHTDVDIAICGAGPVGLVLAGLLVQRGMAPERIALVDAKTAVQSAADPRSIALSYGSRQILEQVGAWPVAAQAISQIHVSRRGHFGRTLLDRADYDLPALGYVTRYGALVAALTAATTQAGIAVRRPLQVSTTQEQA
ncbi:MAG: 2-octaprenyl-6-methoxyphenyl hydroxylase, partial [Oxalobacteraceae bacterium]|nr:2-octaprenyl-6-methoxyphenyl hydroxylase [Oxalobacteraceae bacterium]